MPKYSDCWKWRALIGLPAPQPAANGEARINLRVGGGWAGFAAPLITGTAQLHSVRARVRGLNEPWRLLPQVFRSPATTEVRKLTASRQATPGAAR